MFLAWSSLPGLIGEAGLRNRGVVTEQAELLDGVCKTRKFVLTECEGKLVYRTLPEHGSRIVNAELDYLLLFGLDDQVGFFVKYDPEHPEVHSTSWGLHHFWNRLGTVLLMSAGSIALGLLGFVQAFTPLRRARALEASLQAPRVAVVPLSNLREAGKNSAVDVHFFKDGRARKTTQVFLAQETPLMLGQSENALALLTSDGTPFVLDAALTDLVLSAQERWQIQLAAQAWPASADAPEPASASPSLA